MKEFKQGTWVKVDWEKVYPPFKGTVEFYTQDTVCVKYLGLGREVPSDTVSECNPPKKKNVRKNVYCKKLQA
jgi:hypothetical protein